MSLVAPAHRIVQQTGKKLRRETDRLAAGIALRYFAHSKRGG
jgi:hypothetical protein